ncbi:MAG: small primase-like protein with Toprim domain [Thermoplasmatales archaeon]|nr:small primase-like protein with Toprim domain [Thermoplasmatales archaeon]
MDDREVFEELEELLTELREENKTIPIIVEGEKDITALRKLELTGEILRFNTGQSIPDFCDTIAQKHQKIILLTDWDWRGGRLGSTIKKHLENRVECNMRYRQMFAQHCMCRTVEGIPSWLQTLQKKIQGE